MARIIGKNKALKLRQKGESINEIAKRLNIPKSTISIWCRNIQLTSKQIQRLIRKQESGSYKGRMKFLEGARKKRIEEVAKLKRDGLREISKISKRDLFVAGTAMYVSEGVTSPNSDETSFSNSDPRMIRLMLKWFKEICGILDNRVVIQVRVNKIHECRIKEIENYWSNLTKIPQKQFTKTILIKSESKKIYPKSDTYYGTIRIKIRRGTQLRRKINGWIEGLIRPV